MIYAALIDVSSNFGVSSSVDRNSLMRWRAPLERARAILETDWRWQEEWGAGGRTA